MAIRLTSDGKLDTTFADRGTLEVVAPGINVRDSFGTFNSVLLLANDGILFSGLSGINFGGANIGALLAQFKPDGTSDLSFGINGLSFFYAKQYNEFSTLNLQRLNSSIYLFSPAEIIESTRQPPVLDDGNSGSSRAVFRRYGLPSLDLSNDLAAAIFTDRIEHRVDRQGVRTTWHG